MSSYSPPDDEETSGSEATDGRDVGTQRSFEAVAGLSRVEKAIGILAVAIAGGVVAALAFGQLVPDSALAEQVARALRRAGIDAGGVLSELGRAIDSLLT
ncbi:hypothetical protein [Halorientalis sp.]|uniref:hypothetical protein n=1 Tax=Halorientalis sp. TaxID=1931229 RepID=UPI00260277D2|nr:hypothetical protein [Halorientalis sp.]